MGSLELIDENGDTLKVEITKISDSMVISVANTINTQRAAKTFDNFNHDIGVGDKGFIRISCSDSDFKIFLMDQFLETLTEAHESSTGDTTMPKITGMKITKLKVNVDHVSYESTNDALDTFSSSFPPGFNDVW